jgi:uncharacterized protein
MKFVLTLLVVAVGLWLVMGALRRLRQGGTAPRARPTPPAAAPGEAMVACAHCGVHLPLSDAVPDGTHVYCGEPHRLAGPRKPAP